MEEMDETKPFHALAKKIIRNLYNGSYSHRADMVGKLADTLHPDAVIQFCHWGCKQSSGGSLLLKEKLNEMDIPMLILDGDGIDRRNSHDGQIKTRLKRSWRCWKTAARQRRTETPVRTAGAR